MTKASRKFVHHYAGVAIVVGLLSSFGTWTATRFVTASSAQSALAAAKSLLVQPLADLPGREVRHTARSRAGEQQPSAPASWASHVRLRGRGHLRVRHRRPGRPHSECGRDVLRAADRSPLRLPKPEHGQAHEDHRVHGRRSENPEHGPLRPTVSDSAIKPKRTMFQYTQGFRRDATHTSTHALPSVSGRATHQRGV
jgi:hypothetical protein